MKDCMNFVDKTVMITGASKGIGAVAAKAFAANGANVAMLARSENELISLQNQIENQGRHAIGIRCDVTSETEVIDSIEKIESKYGKIDILVNNAAVFIGGNIEDYSIEDWRYSLSVILDGTFLCSKYVLPGMRERAYGKIINIASSAIYHPFKSYGGYATAKAGLIGFTNTLNEEVKEYNINVNTIILGLTNTDEVKKRTTIPEEKMLQPSDVANVIMMLSSKTGSGFKGAALELYGNYK